MCFDSLLTLSKICILLRTTPTRFIILWNTSASGLLEVASNTIISRMRSATQSSNSRTRLTSLDKPTSSNCASCFSSIFEHATAAASLSYRALIVCKALYMRLRLPIAIAWEVDSHFSGTGFSTSRTQMRNENDFLSQAKPDKGFIASSTAPYFQALYFNDDRARHGSYLSHFPPSFPTL